MTSSRAREGRTESGISSAELFLVSVLLLYLELASFTGAVVGDLVENISMPLAFQHVTLIIAAFYLLSAIMSRGLRSTSPMVISR